MVVWWSSRTMSTTFVAYFVGWTALRSGPLHDPVAWSGTLLTIAGLAALIGFDFGWFRDQMCTIACPFGTVNYVQDTGKVAKCDLCMGDPQCAAACPTGAITYGDADWGGLERMRRWAEKLDTRTPAEAD